MIFSVYMAYRFIGHMAPRTTSVLVTEVSVSATEVQLP